MGIKFCVCSCILLSYTMSFGFNTVRQQHGGIRVGRWNVVSQLLHFLDKFVDPSIFDHNQPHRQSAKIQQ